MQKHLELEKKKINTFKILQFLKVFVFDKILKPCVYDRIIQHDVACQLIYIGLELSFTLIFKKNKCGLPGINKCPELSSDNILLKGASVW